MKKALTASLLAAEIAAFAMLLLLFLLNTNKPYLLLIPLAEAAAAFAVFRALLRSPRDSVKRIAVVLPIPLGLLIAASVIALLYLL